MPARVLSRAAGRKHVHQRLAVIGRGVIVRAQCGRQLVAVAAHDLPQRAGADRVGTVGHSGQDGRGSAVPRPLRQHGTGLLVDKGDAGAGLTVPADEVADLVASDRLAAPPAMQGRASVQVQGGVVAVGVDVAGHAQA